ncbi:hypothetical protein U9M48_037889 [Paspalum notatum var. saurae]|uniref:Uncharacterized protein n=1 Tax=Paspalum notatum var. saurae TaxID=547442 RepID=A0AAQ3UI63_PASNO
MSTRKRRAAGPLASAPGEDGQQGAKRIGIEAALKPLLPSSVVSGQGPSGCENVLAVLLLSPFDGSSSYQIHDFSRIILEKSSTAQEPTASVFSDHLFGSGRPSPLLYPGVRLAGLLIPVGAQRDGDQDDGLQADAGEHATPHALHAAAQREGDEVPDGDADEVVAAEVDIGHEPLPAGADGDARQHRLHAVEQQRAGEHNAQARHRAHHLGALREGRAVHVAERQHQEEEGQPDGHRRHEHHQDRELGRAGATGAQLVGHPHAVLNSPDGDGGNGDLSVLQVADDDDQEHVEPELQATRSSQEHVRIEPEHDGGAERESRESPEVGESKAVEAVPCAGAVSHEDHDEPPGHVKRDGKAEEPHAQGPDEDPAERDVERQRGGGHGGHGQHLALRLQELLDGEVEGVGEELRDHVEREAAGERGDLGVLVEEAQDRGGEEVERQHQHGHGVEDDPRPLQVHAQHVQLLRAVRLPCFLIKRYGRFVSSPIQAPTKSRATLGIQDSNTLRGEFGDLNDVG